MEQNTDTDAFFLGCKSLKPRSSFSLSTQRGQSPGKLKDILYCHYFQHVLHDMTDMSAVCRNVCHITLCSQAHWGDNKPRPLVGQGQINLLRRP